MMPTTVVLTFDQAFDTVTAENASDYRIIGPAGGAIGIKSAAYDPATLTVTLHPERRINIHHAYELIVHGRAPLGLIAPGAVARRRGRRPGRQRLPRRL